MVTPDPAPLSGENRSGTTLVSVISDFHSALDYVEPPDRGPHVRKACGPLSAEAEAAQGGGSR